MLKPGCPVALTVSAAVPLVDVPDFVGMTFDDARRQLNRPNEMYGYALALGTVTYKDSNAAPDTVIEQSPEAHSQVKRDTAINLVVARAVEDRIEPSPPPLQAEPLLEVPDVTGEGRRAIGKNEAIRILQAAGFGHEIVSDGQVVTRQDPPAHERRRRGTIVRLWLRNID